MPVDASSTTLPRVKNGELLDSVVFVELQGTSPEGSGFSARNYLVFDRFRSLGLQQPAFSVHFSGRAITISSPVPAFGVFIETEQDVDLSDNCLILEPNTPCTVYSSAEPGEVYVLDLTTLVARI